MKYGSVFFLSQNQSIYHFSEKFNLRIEIIFFFLFISLFSYGCAGENKIPAWVKDSTSGYPVSRYITGRGIADTPALARDRARADLAKTFQVAIHEKSEERLSFFKNVSSGKVSEESSSEISRTINSQSYQILEGISVSEEWYQSENKIFHALATLDRIKSGLRVQNEIKQLDSETMIQIKISRNENDLIRKIKAATTALNAQEKREARQLILQIIDYSGRGMPSQFDLAKLKSDQNELIHRMKIYIEIQNDPSGKLENLIHGAIAASGFQNRGKDEADYGLISDLNLDSMKDSRGWHWFQGTLTIHLRSLRNEVSSYTHRWNIKVSAKNPDILKNRLIDKLERVLKKELRDTIINIQSH